MMVVQVGLDIVWAGMAIMVSAGTREVHIVASSGHTAARGAGAGGQRLRPRGGGGGRARQLRGDCRGCRHHLRRVSGLREEGARDQRRQQRAAGPR